MQQQKVSGSSVIFSILLTSTSFSRGVSCSSSTDSGSVLSGGSEELDAQEVHPMFPRLHPLVPLKYSLTMQACLADCPDVRPSFKEVVTLLEAVAVDVAGGTYVDSRGHRQVCFLQEATPSFGRLDRESEGLEWMLLLVTEKAGTCLLQTCL
jgi:hypothetical protein